MRLGNGVGYVTQRYSRIRPFDTMNNAIGSRINDYISLITDVRYHVNKHWDVQVGGNLTHISDASYHQPNLGINLYGAHAGVRYFPTGSLPKHVERELKPLKNRWLAQFRTTIAFDGSNAPLGPAYPIYLGTAYVSKRWIGKNKFIGGIDYSYHTNIYSFLLNNQFVTPGTEASHSYKTAVFVGNEFLLGRLGISAQVGVYVHQAFQTQGKVYQKFGGNLYLVQREQGPIKEFFLCGYLKTHLSVAELAEFGFGMGF
ncbi:MAG: lipopolysaccharide lipid 3-O-deacylase, PagL superfamily, partial [Flavipsychrobacter sp.]|nr:lipopolysaccharide lipid 3-O-deacylase, PagL superfamily [Flavipsychrobacter sp.]